MILIMLQVWSPKSSEICHTSYQRHLRWVMGDHGAHRQASWETILWDGDIFH